MILADRKKARIFTIFLGVFEDKGEEMTVEDVPQKVKAEGYRPGHIARHIRDHLLKHLQNIGEESLNYLIKNRIKQIDGIFLGTHKELFLDLKNSLPKKLQKKVIGQFILEPNSAIGDITQKIITEFKL